MNKNGQQHHIHNFAGSVAYVARRNVINRKLRYQGCGTFA